MSKQLTAKIRLVQGQTNWPVSKILKYLQAKQITIEQFYNFHVFQLRPPDDDEVESIREWNLKSKNDFGIACAEFYQQRYKLN